MMRRLAFAVALVAALAVPHALVDAKMSELDVVDDPRRLFAIESFGFLPGGVHKMELWDLKMDDDNKAWDLSKLKPNAGFIFKRSTPDSTTQMEESYAEGICLLDHKNPDDVFVPLEEKKSEVKIDTAGEYRLFFSNCEKNSRVAYKLKIVQYNPGPCYLSAGDAPLPSVFGFISACWVVLLIAWIHQLVTHSENVKKIHYMMVLVVTMKLLSVFFEAIKFHMMKMDGEAHGWNVVYYVFTFLKGVVMFTTILLIGTGWSLFKPFLTEKDKRIVAVVVPLQILTNIAMIYVEEHVRGSQGWLTWRDLLHLMDIACCCAILFPIVWSIKHLRDAAGTDGKAGRNLERLRLFRQFYIMVVSYIYFTRIVVFLLGATLPFGYAWVSSFIYECATLTFFSTTGYRFQPVENNPYLQVADSDDEEDVENKGSDVPSASEGSRRDAGGSEVEMSSPANENSKTSAEEI